MFQNENLILTLHVISAILWLGGVVVFVVTVYPVLSKIATRRAMVQTSLSILRKYLYFISPFVFSSAITGYMLTYARGFDRLNPILNSIINAKGAIWVLIVLNFIFCYYKCIQALQKYESGELGLAKDNVRFITNYLFAINIFLGFVLVYFGILLR